MAVGDVFDAVTDVRQVIESIQSRGVAHGLWRHRTTIILLAGVAFGAIKVREKVLLREELRPGERVVVTEAIVRPTRRQRRAGLGSGD